MDATESDILSFLNTKGAIPPEAEISKRQEERALKDGEQKKDKTQDEVDSDDEDVDQDLLRRGELEG
jgi:tRNA pseudouridine38-40 synthase